MASHRSIFRVFSRCPLWSLVLGVLAGVLLADQWGLTWWLPLASAACLISLAVRKTTPVLMLTGLALAYGLHGWTIENQQKWLTALDPTYQSLHLKIEGVVVDAGPRGMGPYLIKVTETPPELQLPNRVRVQLSNDVPFSQRPDPPLQYGDVIQVAGKLTPVPKLRNPYGFDSRTWLHRQGTNLIMHPSQAPELLGVSWPRVPVRTMSRWNTVLREKMTAGLAADSQEAQLIRAVVLGERPPKPSAMLEDFRNSGTLHVFAVSGLHVGMVGTIIGLVLWFLRVPRWALITFTILGMAMYAGVTGLRPPSVRAVLMATVFLSGFLIQRRPTLINSLAASAVVVLLWDGHQLFTPGFQLSYGVLLALAMLAGIWARVLRPMGEIDPFMPHLLLSPWQERILNGRKWLKNSLSISLAAWMGSAPLMWLHFGIITPIAVIAGIPLMLMVFFILALAMLGLAAGVLWQPAAVTINHANAAIAKATYSTARVFAELPGSHWLRPTDTESGNRIIVFDIPQGGGASIIDLGGGVLLDCGRQDHLYRHVLPTLNALRVSPDSLIISHAEAGHSGGMSHCLNNFHPKQALIPRTDLRSPSYREFLTQAEAEHCRLVIPRLGQKFQIEPGAYLETLHAPAELDGYGLADDTGLVLRLHWHGWRILFTGDAGYTTERRMLDSGMDLSADIIVMGRNSGDFTGSYEFYQAVSPQAIVTTNYHFPSQERVTQSWLKTVEKLNITVFDQQQSGAVTMTLDIGSLTLKPMLPESQPLTLRR
ncbi:ComEC/Rec2 family competence protein [Verrucomicrobiaceae bacterium R5-34]|nr:ComEC/Rec2 family competence protein [Verrucomicrobiaceae bacterium R5-34]